VLCALLAIGASACSLGFDAFDPVAGSQDGGPGESGSPSEAGTPVDAPGGDDSSESDTGFAQDSATQETGGGCPGQQACLSTAASCGMPCTQQYETCAGMCMGPMQQQCRQMCKTTEQTCRTACVQTCVSCTAQGGAGCTDDTGCMTASQM
jgi:hypothetical protein